MEYLSKFDKFNRLVSGWFEWIGIAALLMIMFITCVDVVGAKLFRTPVLGALDIVMLSQVVAVSFATAFALILGRHVCVEFFTMMLPKRPQALLDALVSLLGLGLFILITWRLCVYGHYFQVGGEESATIRIPLYPFAYGVALSGVPVCLVFLWRFFGAIQRMVKK